jgi:hypothetical protein
MKSFYVSMSYDLLHVYIEYKAESDKAVRQYLERQYLRNGVWKLPWCAIYTVLPANEPERYIVKAQCGTIYEEPEEIATR